MSGRVRHVALFGDLPEVVFDVPPLRATKNASAPPIERCAMGYSLKRIRQVGGTIKATLCVRYRYILTSGEQTAQEEVAVKLTFREQDGDWLCQAEPDR